MAFNAENGAWAKLESDLLADSTTAIVQSSALLPTITPFKVKIKKTNTLSKIIQQEIAIVTNVAWNVLTFSRATEKIPYSDTSTTHTQSALDFNTWDLIEVIFTAQDWKDIWEKFDDIESETIPTLQPKCTLQTIVDDYEFTWDEVPNTWFSVITTAWDILIDLDLSLFPATNWMVEFKFCKSTNDENIVTIDVWAWKTIDWVQTYVISNYMETLTLAIVSWTFAKSVASTNRTWTLPLIKSTQELFVAWENITSWESLRYWVVENINITQDTWTDLAWVIGYNTTNKFAWQSITITESSKISKIAINIAKVWTPTGNLKLKIYSNISWTLVATDISAITEQWLTTSLTMTDFIFNNIILSPWTYYLALETDRVTLSTSNYSVWSNSTSSVYAWWTWYSINSSSVWSAQATYDRRFIVYATTTENVGRVYKTNASNINKINIIWFATETVTMWNNIIIDVSWISNTQSWLSTWSNYYLSDTPWNISTTPWTNVVLVWKALNVTWILIQDKLSIQTLLVNQYAFWVNYLANTDWFVCASINWAQFNTVSRVWFRGWVWPASPAIHNIANNFIYDANPQIYMPWITFPVKKWQYWRVDYTDTANYWYENLYFIPLS